ncbi:hypothetical protein NKH77_32215 [Streptomyces sp. M19]
MTVRYKTGDWTVDSSTMPRTGPGGYDQETDAMLDFASDCKVDGSAPFGALLGRSTADPERLPYRRVNREWSFRAARDGTVGLRVNDACVNDNRGALTVTVVVTR